MLKDYKKYEEMTKEELIEVIKQKDRTLKEIAETIIEMTERRYIVMDNMNYIPKKIPFSYDEEKDMFRYTANLNINNNMYLTEEKAQEKVRELTSFNSMCGFKIKFRIEETDNRPEQYFNKYEYKSEKRTEEIRAVKDSSKIEFFKDMQRIIYKQK